MYPYYSVFYDLEMVMRKLPLRSKNGRAKEEYTVESEACTCGVMLIHGPVVHLKRGVAAIPGEAHHMVFTVIYWGSLLFDGDVNCADIEDNSNFPLFL